MYDILGCEVETKVCLNLLLVYTILHANEAAKVFLYSGKGKQEATPKAKTTKAGHDSEVMMRFFLFHVVWFF